MSTPSCAWLPTTPYYICAWTTRPTPCSPTSKTWSGSSIRSAPSGKPYRLLPLPTPRPILYDGERLPATYANFVIINGAVIVPTYKQPDLDAQALATVGDAFPGREVIGIDATVITRQHGSLHCLTMQYPEGILAVSHAPSTTADRDGRS